MRLKKYFANGGTNEMKYARNIYIRNIFSRNYMYSFDSRDSEYREIDTKEATLMMNSLENILTWFTKYETESAIVYLAYLPIVQFYLHHRIEKEKDIKYWDTMVKETIGEYIFYK